VQERQPVPLDERRLARDPHRAAHERRRRRPGGRFIDVDVDVHEPLRWHDRRPNGRGDRGERNVDGHFARRKLGWIARNVLHRHGHGIRTARVRGRRREAEGEGRRGAAAVAPRDRATARRNRHLRRPPGRFIEGERQRRDRAVAQESRLERVRQELRRPEVERQAAAREILGGVADRIEEVDRHLVRTARLRAVRLVGEGPALRRPIGARLVEAEGRGPAAEIDAHQRLLRQLLGRRE
jgi:hypothetical protein